MLNRQFLLSAVPAFPQGFYLRDKTARKTKSASSPFKQVENWHCDDHANQMWRMKWGAKTNNSTLNI